MNRSQDQYSHGTQCLPIKECGCRMSGQWNRLTFATLSTSSTIMSRSGMYLANFYPRIGHAPIKTQVSSVAHGLQQPRRCREFDLKLPNSIRNGTPLNHCGDAARQIRVAKTVDLQCGAPQIYSTSGERPERCDIRGPNVMEK
jgi:hypothetical protein